MGHPQLPARLRRLPLVPSLLAMMAVEVLAAETVTFDLRVGTPLNFREFGGPNVEIVLLRSDASRVDYFLLDYERLIPRARVPRHTLRFYPDHVRVIYSSGVAFVPTISNLSANKQDGFRLDGTLQTVVPLFTGKENRFAVFWHDTLASRQNHLRLLITTDTPAGP